MHNMLYEAHRGSTPREHIVYGAYCDSTMYHVTTHTDFLHYLYFQMNEKYAMHLHEQLV